MAAWSRLGVCHSQVPQSVRRGPCQGMPQPLVFSRCRLYDDAGVSNKQARISQHFKWMTETDVNWNALELKSPCNHLLEPYMVTRPDHDDNHNFGIKLPSSCVDMYASVVGKSKLPTGLPLSKY